MDDLINVRLEEEQIKGSEAGKKIFQTNLYHFAGAGHLAIDYAKLIPNVEYLTKLFGRLLGEALGEDGSDTGPGAQ